MTPTCGDTQKIYDDLFSASFPNEKEGWASGRWGCVLHTEDGGKTWVRQNTGTDLTLSSVFFVDPKSGWAAGEEGIIIHTVDGGKTWEKQKSPVPFFHMKVHFESPLKGWIVSEQTHILHTEDGGKTWSIQFKDQDAIFNRSHFVMGSMGGRQGNTVISIAPVTGERPGRSSGEVLESQRRQEIWKGETFCLMSWRLILRPPGQ